MSGWETPKAKAPHVLRTQGGFDVRYQVKQYVAVVRGPFCRFTVFETGDSQWYLFDQMDSYGCSTTLQFPVLKSDLQPEIRKMLRHGCGNALGGVELTS
jgi:hypothetical protein